MIEHPQLDFDAVAHDPCPQDAPGEAAEVRVKESIVPGEADAPFAVGSKVFLRGCAFGQAGRVLRQERCRAVVYWGDLDYIARHSPDSLMLAEDSPGGSETVPPTNTGLPATLAALLEQVDEGGL